VLDTQGVGARAARVQPCTAHPLYVKAIASLPTQKMAIPAPSPLKNKL
jgi:hypothetical protein